MYVTNNTLITGKSYSINTKCKLLNEINLQLILFRVTETVNNPGSRPAVTITPLDGDTNAATPSTSTSPANVSLNQADTNPEVNNHPLPSVCNLPKVIQGASGIINVNSNDKVKKRRLTCGEARVITGTDVALKLNEKEKRKSKGVDERAFSGDEADDKCHKCLSELPPVKKGKGKGKSKKIDWVCCDHCDKWFHCICVNIQRGSIPESYYCFNCNEDN